MSHCGVFRYFVHLNIYLESDLWQFFDIFRTSKAPLVIDVSEQSVGATVTV